MDIIIGREGESSRLHLVGSGNKEKFIGYPGSVPRSVSRTHCKLTVDEKLNMSVTNLKAENSTFVNGVAVLSKHITAKDVVELGGDRYRLDVEAVLKAFGGNLPRIYSIKHLEQVWNHYHDTKLNVQIKERRANAIRSVSGIFSMMSIACGFIPGIDMTFRIVLYAVALLLGIYFFFGSYRSSSETPKFLDDLDRQFHDDYVCPNPECHHFMGYQPYKELKKNGGCLYCKALFTED